jgi:hypothetical protein
MMKTLNNPYLSMALTLSVGAWLNAQSQMPEGQNGHGGSHPHRPPPPIVQALDADRDHVISTDEIANAASALLTLDKNNDGQLTQDELRPSPPQGQPGGTNGGKSNNRQQGPPPPQSSGKDSGQSGHKGPKFPLMEALDVNHDGILSADEIKNAPQTLKSLDNNGDGELTPDEFAPPRPPQNKSGEEEGMPPEGGPQSQ